MRAITLTTEDASGDPIIGPVCPLDQYISPFNVSLQATVDGTAEYTVEYTLDEVYAEGYDPSTGNWVPITGMTAATANAVATLISPVRAIRLNQGSGDGGVTLRVLQAGI